MDKRQQEDMKPEYDFSKGVRGAVVPKEKVQASLEKSLEDNAEVWGELAGGTTEDWKKPKGGCPRCKGTKKILRAAEGRPDLIGEEDCPDCGGTGDRRKGLEIKAWLFLEHEPSKGIFTEGDTSRQWFLDRRSRKGKRQ